MADLPDRSGLLDESGTVIVDTSCRRCSYNLRGLSEQGRCPECGTPVGLSTQGDMLRFADPAWLESLARGLNFIMGGMAVSFVLCVLTWVFLSIVDEAIVSAVDFSGVLIAVYGTWILTQSDPSGLDENRYGRVRKIARAALVIGLLNGVLRFVLQSAGLTGALFLLMLLAIGAAALIGLVGEFARFIYLEKLAMRIPDKQLADRARFVRWAYSISFAVMIVGGMVVGVVAALSGPAGAMIAPGCIRALATLAMLIFLLMALRLQWRLRIAFREQAAFARDTWARAQGTVAGES